MSCWRPLLKEMKMANVWIVSDTHFGHEGVCRFTHSDGITPLRPWDNAEDMDEAMVKLWNDRVSPKDKVYHLGDVVINRKALPLLNRLNGDKVLIRGNHDIFKLNDYTKFFRDIRSYHMLDGMIFSHVPVHPESLGKRRANVHGHLHGNHVMWECPFCQKIDRDARYLNVSVEQTDFAPIDLAEVVRRVAEQQAFEHYCS